MSSSERPRHPSRRAVLAGLALLAVAGCGFAPVYGPGGVGLALRDRVAVEAPATVPGYRLRERLEQRLGLAATPDYRLTVGIDIRQDATAITAGGDITRYALIGRADWTLRDATGATVVAQGSVDSFTGYNATGTTVATATAEDDARDRLAMILADQIVTRLIAAVAATTPP